MAFTSTFPSEFLVFNVSGNSEDQIRDLILILAINCEFFCKENRSVIASISCFHFYANVINVNCIDKDLLLKTSVLFAKQILTSNLNNETKQKQITDMLSQRNIRTFN